MPSLKVRRFQSDVMWNDLYFFFSYFHINTRLGLDKNGRCLLSHSIVLINHGGVGYAQLTKTSILLPKSQNKNEGGAVGGEERLHKKN